MSSFWQIVSLEISTPPSSAETRDSAKLRRGTDGFCRRQIRSSVPLSNELCSWNGLRDMFIYFGLSPQALGTLRTVMFENLNDKLFRSTMDPVAQVLRDAKMSKSDVTDIVLVGGS